jgi:hypothetical protein
MTRNKIWTVGLAGLSLAVAACLCTSALPGDLFGGQGEAEAPVGTAEPQPEEEDHPLIELPQIGGPELTQTQTSEAGGFSLSLPEGWVVESFFGIMIAAESQEAFDQMNAESGEIPGPVIMGIIGLPEDLTEAEGATSPEDLAQQMMHEDTLDLEGDFEMSEPKSLTVGGLPASSIDMSGTDPDTGQDINVRMVTVLGPQNAGALFGVAPSEDWGDFEGTFDRIIETVEFFEPNPEAALEGMEELFEEGESDFGGPSDLLGEGDVALTDSIEFGGTGSATLEDGTVHHWMFDGTAGQTVTITVMPGDDDMDPGVVLIGPDGSEVAGVDDGFSGEPEVLMTTLPDGGTYTIQIEPFAFGGGSYTIALAGN